MLKTLTVALFAVGMSVGVANATHAHKPMMAGCAEGQQATARCLCGTGAGAARMICNKGEWCHSAIAPAASLSSPTIRRGTEE
jgi:hypothetical protein